jgi:hypothetical protein
MIHPLIMNKFNFWWEGRGEGGEGGVNGVAKLKQE